MLKRIHLTNVMRFSKNIKDSTMDLLITIINATSNFISQMPKEQRKNYGQFFTSKETAIFMADLFELKNTKNSLSILDPGAGSGILSAALIERIYKLYPKTHIKLVCYEQDQNILPLLENNLNLIASNLPDTFSFIIKNQNYILAQQDYYHNKSNTPLTGKI